MSHRQHRPQPVPWPRQFDLSARKATLVSLDVSHMTAHIYNGMTTSTYGGPSIPHGVFGEDSTLLWARYNHSIELSRLSQQSVGATSGMMSTRRWFRREK